MGTEISWAARKTWHSQINKQFFKKRLRSSCQQPRTFRREEQPGEPRNRQVSNPALKLRSHGFLCPLLPSRLPEHLTLILCPDNANQPRPSSSLSSIHCPSFTPPKSEREQLKAEFSSVRVIKEALNGHIPSSLLWAEQSNSPAQKPGHRGDDQWNQLFHKRRGTQT